MGVLRRVLEPHRAIAIPFSSTTWCRDESTWAPPAQFRQSAVESEPEGWLTAANCFGADAVHRSRAGLGKEMQ
jgi:hypothetical protein